MRRVIRGRRVAFTGFAWLVLGSNPAAMAAPLSPPGSLQATARHGQQIDLEWSDASGEVGYRVARTCPEGDAQGFCPLADLPAGAVSYRDVSVRGATKYRYRVEAFAGSITRAAFASATTPSPTVLPAADPPVYFEPQGAWSLGPRLSLAGISRLHVRHNLASRRNLRILLDAGDSHSLVSRLREAGYSIRTNEAYSGSAEAGVAEIYFYDLTRGTPEGPLPDAIAVFDRMGEEGYVLVAEATGSSSLRIVIGANTARGLFRGGMTLQRLLLTDDLSARRSEIEPVIVLDYPDHPLRGSAPSWAPMNANYDFIPEPTLDLLDSLVRSGATAVDWQGSASAQETFHWENEGAWSAALVQVAAAERFMDVSYFMGGAVRGHGTKGPPEVAERQISMDQMAFADGLGVVAEPFSWIETRPGRWQAVSERRGTLHGRNPDRSGRPWRPQRCGPGGWKHDSRRGRPGRQPRSWRLAGEVRDCSLVQSLDATKAFASGGFFLGAWLRASGDAVGLQGELALQIDTAKGTSEFSVALPENLSSRAWQEISLAIPDLDPPAPVEAARLVVRVSLAAGSLWVDDVTLHEWERESFPFGSFADAAGWGLDADPGGFEIDEVVGRRDSNSIRIQLPLVLGKGRGARISGRSSEIRLQKGRYILGAWIKAERRAPDSPDRMADWDGDGLANEAETGTGIFKGSGDTGTDPKRSDTDTDGFPDGIEVGAGSDPNSDGSKPSDYFETKLDINLQFFDGAARKGRTSGSRIAAEYLNFPDQFKLSRGGWFYQTHVFDVNAEMAARTRSVGVQIRIFQRANPGTVWIDDIHLRRLDGDLRNLLGAVERPILRDPSGKLYVEGQDYEVCQVGSRETQCAPPSNYAVLLEGGLTEAYDEDRPPFEIRWLGEEPPAEKRLSISYDIGAQYSSAGLASLSWDDQVVRPAALNFCDIDAVARGIDLEGIFGRYLDGYRIENFPSRGESYRFRADNVTWGVSEIRGINRSIACLDEDGTPTRSNAALFAAVVNKAVGIAKRKHPGVRFFLWDDMFNPFHNGGNRRYQLKYGGLAGASACSLAPASIPSLCANEIEKVLNPIIGNEKRWNEGIVMQPWSYAPTALRPMVAISSWYQGLGLTSQVLPGASPINVEDWAAVANRFDGIQGVVATTYKAHLYGGRSGLLPALQKFWNHDWRLLYLYDSETPASSHYRVPWPFTPSLELTNAVPDTRGECAAAAFTFSGNNDGGICLGPAPAEPRIKLEGIPVRAGAAYRIDFLARSKAGANSSPGAGAPELRVHWSNGKSAGPRQPELIYESRKFSDRDGFDRYRLQVEAPVGAAGMNIEIAFGTSDSKSAVDDIAIFESVAPCFNACEQEPPRPARAREGKTEGH